MNEIDISEHYISYRIPYIAKFIQQFLCIIIAHMITKKKMKLKYFLHVCYSGFIGIMLYYCSFDYNEKGLETMQRETWKPSTLLGPIPPVMVTCGTMEQANIITIAWTGIINTIPPMTYISVRPERYSYDIIKNTGEFVINLTTTKLVKAADFCGVRTGSKLNKFEEMKLTKAPVSQLACPCIDESPLNLECKVKEIIPLGSHHMFLAEIVAVNVAEEYIDETGKLCLDKANLVAFAHGEYYELGRKFGSFGYSVRKKKSKKKPKSRK